MDDREYSYLKKKIHQCTNLDLDGYKSQQIRRRLEGYITRYSRDVREYCTKLEADRSMGRDLVDYLAINVSEFFRDTNYFDYLKNEVLPELGNRRSRLNIWSAACSCGQEPYSLAILLEELKIPYRLLATDIDLSALETARKGGPYTASDVRNVDPRILRTYFTCRENGYWINETLPRKIIFKMHNLQSDTYEKGFDLILCRNAIIYFSDQVREKIFQGFHDSLINDAVLFIGGSEAILHSQKFGFKPLRPPFYTKMTEPRVAAVAAGVPERRAH